MNAVLVVLMTLGAGAPAIHASTQETPPKFLSGVVLAVDPSNSLLSVEEASLDAVRMTFTLAPDAEIRKGNADLELGQIRVGNPVTVRYENTRKGPLARAVRVITKPDTH